MMRAAILTLLLAAGFAAAQDDTKLKRGVEAAPAPAVPPPAPAGPATLADRVYAVPVLVLAGVSAILIVGAICLPIKKFDGEE